MERFVNTFPETAREPDALPRALPPGLRSPEASAVLERYAGATFADGIYRVHHARSGLEADARVAAAFPWLAGRVYCLGFTWRGEEFALDAQRRVGDEPLLLLLDPGHMDAWLVPFTVSALHAETILSPDGGLYPDLFAAWRAAHPDGVPIPFDECVGLVIPLFLGGTNAIENLARTPIDVYWELHTQIAHATQGLPDGTAVDEVSLSADE